MINNGENSSRISDSEEKYRVVQIWVVRNFPVPPKLGVNFRETHGEVPCPAVEDPKDILHVFLPVVRKYMVDEFPVKSKIEEAVNFMEITDKICNDEPAADGMFSCTRSNRYCSGRTVNTGHIKPCAARYMA